MIVLTITSQTWLVTGLGFALVLLLLFVFVYIMKGLGLIMNSVSSSLKPNQPAEKKVYATDADSATRAAIAMTLALNNEDDMAAIAMTLALAQDDDEMAAIAYSLHQFYGRGHDISCPQLTLVSRPTVWNSKTFGINNLYR